MVGFQMRIARQWQQMNTAIDSAAAADNTVDDDYKQSSILCLRFRVIDSNKSKR